MVKKAATNSKWKPPKFVLRVEYPYHGSPDHESVHWLGQVAQIDEHLERMLRRKAFGSGFEVNTRLRDLRFGYEQRRAACLAAAKLTQQWAIKNPWFIKVTVTGQVWP